MHRKKIDELYAELDSGPDGLTQKHAAQHLRTHGLNIISTKKHQYRILEFLKEFLDLMVVILILASAIAYALGETTDAIVIFVVVIINALISFIQKYQADKAIEALKQLTSPHARILREGKIIDIDAALVVPGDVLILSAGDRVPADARIMEATQFECDESILTGESAPIQKQSIALKGKFLPKIEHTNSVFLGTVVTHGFAKAVVFATGTKTELGKIANLTLSTKQDSSPLQKELKKIGLFTAILTGVLSILLFAIGYFYQGKAIIDNILFTVSVAVAAVPEGLPATITIALALGVKRLARKKAIVKQLSSVETLGSTTVILSDKTGTITKNEMTIKELFFNNLEAEIKGVGYVPKGSVAIKTASGTGIVIGSDDPSIVDEQDREKDLKTLADQHPKIFETLNLIAITGTLCNNSKLTKESDGNYNLIGAPTEGAILTLIKKSGFDITKIINNFGILETIPFDSERKRMSVIVRNLHSREILSLTKGDPQRVLDRCTRIMLNGQKIDLTKEMRLSIVTRMETMANSALRVIAFAYKEMPVKEKEKYTEEATENSLTFLGLAGMIDPPRKDIREAIAITKDAGIKTYIVTGDHGLTAAAIARQIDLITTKDFEIITGEDLNKMSDSKLKNLLKDKSKEIVFARVSPQHKLKLVSILKEMGEIVAVTGDGVNDGPALKRADIGVAMGVKGTDVAKEAANMVLTDDSFVSIVHAIEEGRTIYHNMKKFISYIFSGNIGELITILTAIIFAIPSPLTAILILVVNLGSDLLPALALGIERPEKGVMSLPPRSSKDTILSRDFIIRIVYQGIAIGGIVLGVFVWNLYRYGWLAGEPLLETEPAYLKSVTMALATIVVIQFINAYNSRSVNKSIFTRSIFTNGNLFVAAIFSITMLYAITEIPLTQQYLGLTTLNSDEWSIVFVASLGLLLIEETRKIFIKFKE